MDGIIASFACRRINTAHPMILVTGGAGFIGANFVLDWLPTATSPWSTSTSSPTPATCTTSPACRATPPHLRAGRHRRPALLERLLAEHQPAPSSTSPSACGPLHPRPRRLHPDQRRRHLQAFGGCKAILEALPATKRSVPLPACLHRRGLRHPLTDPAFTEDNPTSPTARTRPARPPATTWCAPGTTPTACRCSPPTAATTTARCTSRKSSSR
jgi:dTDP-glucose 4,6-dehydratase